MSYDPKVIIKFANGDLVSTLDSNDEYVIFNSVIVYGKVYCLIIAKTDLNPKLIYSDMILQDKLIHSRKSTLNKEFDSQLKIIIDG